MIAKIFLLLFSVCVVASQSQAFPGIESCDFSGAGTSSQGYARVRTLENGAIREELYTDRTLIIQTTEGKNTTRHVFDPSLFDPNTTVNNIYYAGQIKNLPTLVITAITKNEADEQVHVEQLFLNPPSVCRLATFSMDTKFYITSASGKLEVKIGGNSIMVINSAKSEENTNIEREAVNASMLSDLARPVF